MNAYILNRTHYINLLFNYGNYRATCNHLPSLTQSYTSQGNNTDVGLQETEILTKTANIRSKVRSSS